jgi:hypothetical protein
MGTTLLEVCNRALSRIGVARIGALTEATAGARAVAACFPSVPDWVLRIWRWSFAIKRVPLLNPQDASETGYAWRYELPADYLNWAGDALGEFHSGVLSVVEGGSLLTDKGSPFELRYVSRVIDAGDWDAAFAEVVAWKIALEVQPELAPGAVVATLLNEFHESLRDAHRSGAIEMVLSMGTAGDDWLIARI